MRASRLLALLLALSGRGQASAAELAAELEVSVRTIYRDVEALSAAGVPVYCSRGRHGGVHLLPGYRTRLTGLTGDEADALFLSGVPSAAADLGWGGVLAAGQVKLLAALPDDLRDRAARIRDRFLLDSPGWLRGTETPAHLATVADAAWRGLLLDVRYERSDRTVGDRVLAPLGLVLKGGTWYAVACRAESGTPVEPPRTYRLSRVHAAAVREQPFDRPRGFDLETFWAGHQADYAQRVYRQSAKVRLDELGRDLLFLLGEIPSRDGRAGMGPVGSDGWATTTVPIESIRHGVHALLQLGPHAEVLDPPELRDAIGEAARATAARYG